MSALGQFSSGGDGPVCGCGGCTDPAEAVIDHPEYGERVVCDGHIVDHEVVRRV